MTSKAYIIAVDMGYGHQRAVFPLADIAKTPEAWNINDLQIISADNYPGIPEEDKNKWQKTRKIYEWVSRINSFPVFGKRIFGLMNYLERIEDFYPKRDLSDPVFQTKIIYKMIRSGFGKHLIDTLSNDPLPLVTSFFITAFFAEEHGYTGEIYCLCTDTDISRVWAPMYPEKSKIIYLAPNNRVKERLKLYGVPDEKIIIVGFPIPKEILGDKINLDLAKKSLARRIIKLDPKRNYQKKYNRTLSLYLGELAAYSEEEIKLPVTLTFAVGGAGAQVDIGVKIFQSLQNDIRTNRIRLNLVAGTSEKVLEIYKDIINEKGVNVLYYENKFEYFKGFNNVLSETDILWTKPSELSFYVGAGIPIIMAPPLGAQEESNKDWLHMVGAGFEQGDPEYTDEWLFDWIDSGWLAEAAMNGFIDAPKRGVFHIEDLILRGKKIEIENIHFI